MAQFFHQYFPRITLLDLAKIISPFRTARTGNLRNEGEYMVELMAQYLIEGGVTFNYPVVDVPHGNEKQYDRTEQEDAIYASAKETGWSSDIYTRYIPEMAKDVFKHMKGNPLRPKTTKDVITIWNNMVDGNKFGPNSRWSKSDKMRYHLKQYEKDINELFTGMLKSSYGKFVVI